MPKKIDVSGLDHYHDKVSAMLASEYSSSKTYAVGEYCFHAGTLYKCTTAITTAEAWTSGHWTAAKLAEDTSALKTAIVNERVLDWANFTTKTYTIGWTVGNYRASNGTPNSSQGAMRTGFCVYIPKSNVIEFVAKAPTNRAIAVYEYDLTTNQYLGIYGELTVTTEVRVTPKNNCYYKFSVGGFNSSSDPSSNYLTKEFIDTIIVTERYYLEPQNNNKHLNILIMGNSYSADSWSFVPFILKKYGITCNIHLYYRGGGSIDRLVAEWEDDTATGTDDFGESHIRRYTHIDTRFETAWEAASTDFHYSPKQVLQKINNDINTPNLDLIVLNTSRLQAMFTKAPGNGDPRKGAEPYIRQAINLINETYTKPYTLAWEVSHTSFDGYEGNVQQGYPAITPEECDNRVGILKSAETIIGAEPFNMVIPTGTAIFNSRTNTSLASTNISSTGNLWSTDKVHLQAGIPTYIANCAVVQSLFNKFFPHLSILNDNTRITDQLITDYACPFISAWCGSVLDNTELLYDLGQKAAVMACKYPYDITPIYLPTDTTELELFDTHSDRYWADDLITQPST